MPDIFIKVYDYFVDVAYGLARLRTPFIFRAKVASTVDVDNLERHIMLGDYDYIDKIENPHVVANYFKAVL